MYCFRHNGQLSLENFYHPFGGKLDPENRWVKLSDLFPWEQMEGRYAAQFNPDTGAPAKPFRMALAALYIKERLGITDRETVQQITENPYLQFFVGLEGYQSKPPFDPSMMVYFRKRLGEEILQECNEIIVRHGCKTLKDIITLSEDMQASNDSQDLINRCDLFSSQDDREISAPNLGTLSLDASCAPADIAYPTDLGLLNEACETVHKVIEQLFQQIDEKTMRKPRCNKDKVRNTFLGIIRQKKPKYSRIREAKHILLVELSRGLKSIDRLIASGASLVGLSRHLYHKLLVSSEVYRQQQEMYDKKVNRVDDRIVNFAQPHVRPIVRGKAAAKTEFGAKISASDDNGFVFLDRLEWDAYNESSDLIPRIEKYKQDKGFYPERVCVDQIYMTQANRKFCKEHGIRLSGRPLGRPRKNPMELAEQRELFREDQRKRNAIEGRFGTGKRKYNLDRIMAKLEQTARSAISMVFLVMNAETLLRLLRLIFVLIFSVISWLQRLFSGPGADHGMQEGSVYLGEVAL